MPDAPVDGGPPILETQLVAPTVLAPDARAGFGAPAAGRRFSVGAVLSRTLRVWWAHALAFSGMSLVVYAPMLVVFTGFWLTFQRAALGRAPEPAELVRQVVILLAGMLATMVLSVVQMGAVTYGTVRWLNGERTPFGRMLGVGLRRGLPVVGTGLAVWVVVMAGMLLLFVPGMMFLVASCVAVPAAVVERPGIAGALRRSFELTRGSRWPLFAAGFVIVVVMWLLSAGVQLGALLLAAVLPPAHALAVTAVSSQVGSALFSVLPVVAVAVCYHDLRLAKEGVDTAELARVFE